MPEERLEVQPDEDEETKRARRQLQRVDLNAYLRGRIERERQRPGSDKRKLNQQARRLEAESLALLTELGDASTAAKLSPILARTVIEAADAEREPSKAPPAFLKVPELAAAIGQSDYTTRRLLHSEQIPGARQKTPGVPNSPWLIPPDAPARYLERHAHDEQGR